MTLIASPGEAKWASGGEREWRIGGEDRGCPPVYHAGRGGHGGEEGTARGLYSRLLAKVGDHALRITATQCALGGLPTNKSLRVTLAGVDNWAEAGRGGGLHRPLRWVMDNMALLSGRLSIFLRGVVHQKNILRGGHRVQKAHRTILDGLPCLPDLFVLLHGGEAERSTL